MPGAGHADRRIQSAPRRLFKVNIFKLCHMKLFASVFLLLCMSLPAIAQEAADATYKSVETPEGFDRQIDVVYTTVKDWEGRMDIYTPPNKGKATPIVINIHGGGWNKGVKESQTGFNTFFKMNYAVAN